MRTFGGERAMGNRGVVVDGHSLKIEQVVASARDPSVAVTLDPSAEERIARVRAYVERNWLHEDAPPVYGINTGVGKLKDHRVSAADNRRFQELLLESHSAAIGEPAAVDWVRATMVARANTLAKGLSGVRPEVVRRLIEMVNRDVVPVVPSQGSVGASGDLAPLAHIAAAMAGHPKAEAYFRGERMPAARALQLAGIEPVPFRYEAKDVLSLINGCTFTLGLGVLVFWDAMELVRYAELACALSMEAMRAVRDALDDRIHAARNHPGQRASAEMLRSLLEGSQWVEEEARGMRFPYERPAEHGQRGRVQDAYSLRCAPQVHGAARDVLDFVRVVLERELNAATDNPLVLPASAVPPGPGAPSTEARTAYEVLSGGNFHGEIIAFAMDFLAVAVHELGSISERRSARFLDPTMSYGLPPNLVGTEPGLNTGFAVVQCVASSLVAENRTLCTPASVDSIPTKGNQEDHVSMATWAARKARRVVENCRAILAVEILCACQGISLAQAYLGGLSLGRGTEAAYRALRRRVPATADDRYMNEQLSEVIRMMKEDSLLEGVR